MTRIARRLLLTLLVIALLGSASAQNGKPARAVPLEQRQWHTPLAQHAIGGGLWRTDHSFGPSLHLRNTVETDPISE